MFKEDVVQKEKDPKVLLITDFIKSLIYSLGIHFVSYCFKLPSVYSVIPLMVLILLIMLFTREWNDKKRQYAFLIPYVAEYFGFVLYFHDRGHLMPLTAVCMTAILAVWGVICIECFSYDKKKNLIGFVSFALVAVIAYVGIWANYSAKSEQMVKKLRESAEISETLGREADALCTELNSVFYSKKKIVFQLEKIVRGEIEKESVMQDYQTFRVNIKSIDGKWISSLFSEAEKIAGSKEMVLK